MDELALLNKEQIWGSGQLEVLKKYGVKAAITDLAILTGAYVEDIEYNIEGRIGWQWTFSSDSSMRIGMVDEHGFMYYFYKYERYGVVRPVLKSSIIFSQISPNIVKDYNGVEEVEYGEYPQMAPDKKVQDVLEDALQSGKLKATGKKYTFDSVKYHEYYTGFQPVSYDEYEYNGKKYIRVKANTCYNSHPIQLSNGEYYKSGDSVWNKGGDFVWIEVQPVRWLVDRKSKTLIAKKGLVSGIRYLAKDKTYTGDFKETEMYTYLNTYLIKEIIPSKTKKVTSSKTKKATSSKTKEATSSKDIVLGSSDCYNILDELRALREQIVHLVSSSEEVLKGLDEVIKRAEEQDKRKRLQ